MSSACEVLLYFTLPRVALGERCIGANFKGLIFKAFKGVCLLVEPLPFFTEDGGI